MRKSLACIFCLLFSICAFSQDFSNKGKDFYLCFPQHVPANMGAGLAVLSIYITSDKASSGTITMANAAFSSTFSIAPNGLQEIQIPWDANIHISNAESNTVIKKSIRIKTNPGMPAVVAYAQQWAGARSAATLLLPVNVLGKKYYAVSFTQFGSNNGTFQARSQFQVIATKDNTVISITPRKNGMLGSAFTITLPLAGDMYQYQSTDGDASTQDLTGTLIESVASGSGGCLPIAVFQGVQMLHSELRAVLLALLMILYFNNYILPAHGEKTLGLFPLRDIPMVIRTGLWQLKITPGYFLTGSR